MYYFYKLKLHPLSHNNNSKYRDSKPGIEFLDSDYNGGEGIKENKNVLQEISGQFNYYLTDLR